MSRSPHLLPAAKKKPYGWPLCLLISITPGLLTVPFPRISFAISAFDTQTGSSNPNGIFEAVPL